MLQIKEEIQKVRNSVKFIRASPQRQQKFEEVCLQVNAPNKKLIQDVDTRWNSTYMMLETALLFREAFSRYGKFEPDFLKVAPGEEDWNNASSLSVCLKVFYELTVLFSGSKHITVNRYFDYACCLYVEIHEWCNSSDKLISKMALNMMERFEKYWEITWVAQILVRYPIPVRIEESDSASLEMADTDTYGYHIHKYLQMQSYRTQ